MVWVIAWIVVGSVEPCAGVVPVAGADGLSMALATDDMDWLRCRSESVDVKD